MKHFVELKNHAFFNGIDWQLVADRRGAPAFELKELQINFENELNLTESHDIFFNDHNEASLNKRFPGKSE